MRRREFIALLGGVTTGLPLMAHAQQPAGATKRVAVLMGSAESDPATQVRLGRFTKGLAEKGWTEGRNVRMEVRWGEANAARAQALARELVDLAPDVILATNTPTARALKLATATVPVVFAGLADPVADGIAISLSKPGGNITGFTSFNAAIAGKWLQLLKEISPGIDRVAVMYNPTTAPYAIFLPVMQAVAPQIGVTLIDVRVGDVAAIESALAQFANALRGGLVVMPDVFLTRNRDTIFRITNQIRLPTMCPLRSFAVAGGLMSYGSNFDDLFEQAATYVDRILRGEKPGDLPVQEPTRYEAIINLQTAKAIGVEIPSSLLATADEVIE
jgi:putative tryptophan/tyrosine transport system substrate-binding protein